MANFSVTGTNEVRKPKSPATADREPLPSDSAAVGGQSRGAPAETLSSRHGHTHEAQEKQRKAGGKEHRVSRLGMTEAGLDVPHSKQSLSTVWGCPALLASGQVWTPGACRVLSPTSGPTYVWLSPTPSRWRISSFLPPGWHLWFRCSPQHRRNFQLEAGVPLPEQADH